MGKFYRGRKKFKKYGKSRKSTKYNKSNTSLKKYRPTMVRGIGISNEMFTKLKYNTNLVLTMTLGSMVTYQFRGNALYDPDLTGTGQQPQYFDQYALLFNKYRVAGSKVRLAFSNTTASVADQQLNKVVLSARPTTDMYSNLLQASEAPNSRTGFSAFSATAPGKLVSYRSTSQVEGIKKIASKIDDDFASAVTTNPTNQWYWTIYAGPFNSQYATTCTIVVDVNITYYVKFYDRKLVEDA